MDSHDLLPCGDSFCDSDLEGFLLDQESLLSFDDVVLACYLTKSSS